jgi:hypothetical protein
MSDLNDPKPRDAPLSDSLPGSSATANLTGDLDAEEGLLSNPRGAGRDSSPRGGQRIPQVRQPLTGVMPHRQSQHGDLAA